MWTNSNSSLVPQKTQDDSNPIPIIPARLTERDDVCLMGMVQGNHKVPHTTQEKLGHHMMKATQRSTQFNIKESNVVNSMSKTYHFGIVSVYIYI